MKIEKTICDKCKSEIDVKDFYYSVKSDVIQENYEVGQVILKKGDYCKECFKEKIKIAYKED